MLRDRIVWGINDDATQRKLLQVKDLTYEKAVRVAQGFETADKDLKEMHHAPSAEPTSSSSAGIQVQCTRCQERVQVPVLVRVELE